MCRIANVYIDFSKPPNNQIGVEQLTMEKYLKKCDPHIWTKYENLFQDFFNWCKNNHWWYDGNDMRNDIYPKEANPIRGFCSEQRENMI